jgi:hypothetical protein
LRRERPTEGELSSILERFHAAVEVTTGPFAIEWHQSPAKGAALAVAIAGAGPAPRTLGEVSATKTAWVKAFLASYARARYPGRYRR